MSPSAHDSLYIIADLILGCWASQLSILKTSLRETDSFHTILYHRLNSQWNNWQNNHLEYMSSFFFLCLANLFIVWFSFMSTFACWHCPSQLQPPLCSVCLAHQLDQCTHYNIQQSLCRMCCGRIFCWVFHLSNKRVKVMWQCKTM